MLPLIERWRGWAMRELWPFSRRAPRSQGLHFGYEKAGLVVYGQPIPWNAEAVLVEGALRLSPASSRRKGDYTLRVPGREPIVAEQLRRKENDHRHCVQFRLEPPGAPVPVELFYRGHLLGRIMLPFIGQHAFVHALALELPTVQVRLGEQSVACQTFVANQCRGLLASAVVVSPTSLVPLLDLDLQVEFTCESGRSAGTVLRASARLCTTQLADRRALVTLIPPRFPRRIGSWIVRWLVGDRVLAQQRLRAISQRQFQQSLRISDTRFVVQTPTGAVFLSRHVPPLETIKRLGPCFLVASSEQGMAGQCGVRVAALVPGTIQAPPLLDQDVLISDGPTTVAPGTIDVVDLHQVTGFDLSIASRSLGMLSMCPAPTANFNSEGGFKAPRDFTWSAAAEDELTERLNRLLEGRGQVE